MPIYWSENQWSCILLVAMRSYRRWSHYLEVPISFTKAFSPDELKKIFTTYPCVVRCRWCSSQVSLCCIWEKASNVNISYQYPQSLILLHYPNDAFSITEPSPHNYWDVQYHILGSVCGPPKSLNQVFQPPPTDVSPLGGPTLVKGWNAAYQPVCLKLLISDKCHWILPFLMSALEQSLPLLFKVEWKIQGERCVVLLSLAGMPPQLTDSIKYSFGTSLQAESLFFVFIHSFALFLHLPFGLSTSVTWRAQSQGLSACAL